MITATVGDTINTVFKDPDPSKTALVHVAIGRNRIIRLLPIWIIWSNKLIVDNFMRMLDIAGTERCTYSHVSGKLRMIDGENWPTNSTKAELILN